MPLRVPNLVQWTTTTSGTGALTIGSAVTGFLLPTGAGMAVGDTAYYVIQLPLAAQWEIGLGTLTATSTWTRTTVLANSSGTTTALNISGGTSTVYFTTPGVFQLQAFQGGNTAIGRNVLHNSRFTIQQRGAGPFTTTGIGLDRWNTSFLTDTDSVTAYTMTDADRVALSDEYAEYAYLNAVTGNSAAGAYSQLVQSVEDVRKLAGKVVTFSFWAKATGGAPNIGIRTNQYFGTGGSPSASVVTAAVQQQIGGSWTRYSFTISLATAQGKTLGTNGDSATQFYIGFSSGSTNASVIGVAVQTGFAFYLWGMQVEIGTVATALEYRDQSVELALCQRFYELFSVNIRSYAAAATAYLDAPFNFKVTKRSAPTLTQVTAGTASNATGLTLYTGTSNDGGRAEITSGAAGDSYALTYTYSASSEI